MVINTRHLVRQFLVVCPELIHYLKICATEITVKYVCQVLVKEIGYHIVCNTNLDMKKIGTRQIKDQLEKMTYKDRLPAVY